MDAAYAGAVLNAWFPVRSGYDPTPRRGSGRTGLDAVFAEQRAGYPYPTTSQARGVPPVLYVGDVDRPSHPDYAPNRRRIADHPHTAERPPLVLPDPQLLRFADNPLLRSHHAVVAALTLKDTANALAVIASEPGQPRRAFAREATTYLSRAASLEDLLDDYVKPWFDIAQDEIARSTVPPSPTRPRTQPVTLR